MSNENKKKRSLLARIFLALLSLAVLAVAVVAIVCLFFLKPIVKKQIESRAPGYTVSIDKLSLNPFTANLVLDGFTITNPASEFKTPGFVDLRALHGELSISSLLSDRIVLNNARLDLPSVTLVRRDKNRPSNAELFANRIMGEGAAPAQPDTKPAEPSKPLNFLIKRLDVNVGKVVVANETSAGEASSRDYVINYKYSYENITEPKQFMTRELAQSLLGVGSQLTDMIPGKFGESVDSVLKGGVKVLDNPQEAAGGAVKGLLNKLVPSKDKKAEPATEKK